SGRVRADLDALPLAFEANQGQTDPQVKYMARGKGYTAFLTADETVFAMQSARANAGITGKRALLSAQKTDNATKDETGAIRMKLVGANENAPTAAENELPGHSNYFIGNDRSQWHAGVKQYARVSYNQVYPGVNLAFHGQQKQLEFDFIVAPGADPKAIRFDVSGAKKISTDSTGNLVLASAAGDVVLHKPVTYQRNENVQQAVDSRFVVAKNTVSFEVGNYDRRRELVIDPAVSYATYLGGAAEDDAYSIAVDGSGAAYVTGQTKSLSFPGASGSPKGGFDAFVSKISPTGTSLDYSTFVGGSQDDSGISIALDGSGDAYVCGGTKSTTDFPAQPPTVYQPTYGGGTIDGFIFELSSTGSLVFSTYIGGNQGDIATAIAVDMTGVYVTGNTSSNPFPTTSGAYQTALIGAGNGFITKLNTSGGKPAIYSTLLGAGGESFNAIDVDSVGNAYVTGAAVNGSFPHTAGVVQTACSSCSGSVSDAFVSVINPTGTNLVYSTFLGGSALDQGLGIAVDKASGNAYVTGVTQSANFPATLGSFGGIQNAFVTALNATGTSKLYSTFLGGTGTDLAAGIAVDSSQNAYVTGQTNSGDFPVVSATQGKLKGGADAFVSELSASGSLIFSTFMGGTQNENSSGAGNLTGIGAIAVDPAGSNIYIAGNTASSDFPSTAGSVQAAYGLAVDAFVAKYSTGASSANFTVTNGALSPTSGHAGVSANATVTVTSTAGFSSAVALTCSVSPAVTKGPTCSLSPASVTPPANGTATSTLTVSTTAAAARLENPFDGRGVFFATIIPVFGLTLVGAGMGSSDSRRRKLFGLFLLGIIGMSLLLMPACSSSSTTVGGGNGGTPAGAYTITVTGTSGGASATGTPAITLTIN
ncbi:MAG: SBBP repeat-containing protein, partial [Acidobacteriota bacterium]